MDVNANRMIGTCLRQLRIDGGLTQNELAEKLGKPQSYVSKIEMGERILYVSELFAYSDALDLSSQDVLASIEKCLHRAR